ncbi:MAG: hypothetical protein IJK33_09140 [Clostridia bacterium]|nr:hypothetical protein [Clostridia bacterium]MBQ6184033.1 hypothetical protein [Clostridia bacterium]
MKVETVKRWGFAFIIFLVVLVSVSAIFAYVLLKTDADKTLAFYAGCAADLISVLISCGYLVRASGRPYDALIFSALLAILLLCFSLFAGAESVSSFASPLVCAAAGLTVFVIMSRTKTKRPSKRKLLRRR